MKARTLKSPFSGDTSVCSINTQLKTARCSGVLLRLPVRACIYYKAPNDSPTRNS